MEMNWEKYNLQICHLLILQIPSLFAVGTETGVLVFPVRLLGSQFYCHSSITVWARKMSFLSGVRGILWKHFTLPKVLIWIWSSCWYDSCDFSDFRDSAEGFFVVVVVWGFVSILSSCERSLCADKDWDSPCNKSKGIKFCVKPYTFSSSLNKNFWVLH